MLCTICIISHSCHRAEIQLTEAQKQEITNAASAVVKKVFEYSNNMDFETGLDHYSEASSSYFIIDGMIHSLSDLRKAYRDIGPSVEALQNTIESWNIQILSPNVVTFALPVQLELKLKGVPEFSGQLVWTATLQKQGDRWVIVQSHESWLNCADVAAALTPASNS